MHVYNIITINSSKKPYMTTILIKYRYYSELNMFNKRLYPTQVLMLKALMASYALVDIMCCSQTTIDAIRCF